ncbi:DUF1176 domain-containing protein [Massilia sp. YIM B02769]|uniref:DUF1176 domain-containing protein n=1 Tax=Massilia sp. YIM B02769 TaxID=3050129 RepID=UPI0025B656FE|nr:DUF1176 domain-containing protein [Massilia sp. YIM B02769]MDN4058507.1 DUF1176 domain-containing protein [Massilia sp. YIM B02769]
MKRLFTAFPALGLSLLAASWNANGAELPRLRFSYGDWEIACDNTRTCRAAGYDSENSSDAGNNDGAGQRRMSVLLTRKAGPDTLVHAELQIGTYEDTQPAAPLPRTLSLTMTIDGKEHGKVAVTGDNPTVDLAPGQTQALLAALTRVSKIAWTDGPFTWRLSDAGAAAVLLKMDAFQGRVGTPGALVRKGARLETSVLAPLPEPVVRVPALDDRAIDLPAPRLAALRQALKAPADTCTEPDNIDGTPGDIAVWRLTGGKLLASLPCWRAAYNEGAAYWVVNARPPYAPRLVTTAGNGYASGIIGSSLKGRGLGDCFSFDEWTWDGKVFVHSSEGDTGDCRLVAPGGAWVLPVMVTAVQPARPTNRP